MTIQGSSSLSNQQGSPLILELDHAAATLEQVGGKGASLARLAAFGLPVPPGFHITTAAYCRFVAENRLQEKILAAVSAVSVDQPTTLEEASRLIAELFVNGSMPHDLVEAIRQAYAELGGDDLSVAVRSSATAEDLPEMSFAGQQETYLNVHGEAMVLDAVRRCWASLWTARAIAYRLRHEIAPETLSLAVVVQKLVPADAAGVLFTANPLTGARDQITINAAWGLGEAIVGGLVTPDTIVVDKASGKIVEQQIHMKDVMTTRTSIGTHEEPVPRDRRTQAVLTSKQVAELARMGGQIEQLYGRPMDIEWVQEDNLLWIVQARPITALREQSQTSEVWNDSLTGNYLWTNANLSEAVPDVMTPCTWSLIQVMILEVVPLPALDGYHVMGNIGGHSYMNLSLLYSLAAAFGMGRQRFIDLNENFFGRIPDTLEIPLIPLSRWSLLPKLLPDIVRLLRLIRTLQKQFPDFMVQAPARCDALHAQIKAASSPTDLISVWQADLEPYYRHCLRMLRAVAQGVDRMLRSDLRKLVGEADMNALISGLSTETNQLASLGPLIGLEQLAHHEIDRATYIRLYGHRGPHEFEVSIARSVEDPDWLDRQLASLNEAPVNVTELLARQQTAHEAAWERFRQRYPSKVAKIRRRIEQSAFASRNREMARSELIRAFWVLRAFALRAGVLTGQGDDIFFLSIDEILNVLRGDQAPLALIPSRRALYERCCALPSYPALIRGRFDPFQWAANPQRRSDIFDERGESTPVDQAIRGFPGSEGIVEGRVRVLATVEEGEQLQAGEILVTTMTNVGWTPLFPRAAAIVTDVGAPLSHAAIVARELGIPAVVGCGNATMRLHNGDCIRVNGEQGTVEVLQAAESTQASR